jgi:CheY-like chemotaxis protein
MKILGIDDNEDLLQLCEIAVSTGGHEYASTNNGKDGLELIRKQDFDVVLLDLSMPDFSGLDVLDALVNDGIINKQKIVVFTASPPSEEQSKSLFEKGVHSILTKPLDPDLLLDHLEKII